MQISLLIRIFFPHFFVSLLVYLRRSNEYVLDIYCREKTLWRSIYEAIAKAFQHWVTLYELHFVYQLLTES